LIFFLEGFIVRTLLLFFFPFVLFAHPHLFVDVKIDKKDDILSVDWVFDEMNSEILIMDYDTDFDRVFSQSEKDKFTDEVITDLIMSYNFYTFIDIDNKKVDPTSILQNIDFEVKNNNFLISFDLNMKKFQKSRDFKLTFYDESFMSAFVVKKVDLLGFQNIKISEDEEFYGYQIHWRK
jgi:ABC-type uncharacterized transport system substrate-binding protein